VTVAFPESLAHHFTPSEAPGDRETIDPVFERLLAMPVDTEEDLQAFLDAWNETTCWIRDHVTKSQVASVCHTDDEDARDYYMKLVSTVVPALSTYDDELGRKLLESPHVETLEETDYAPFLRQVRVAVELFRDENVPLQQKTEELSNQYQQISGGWAIDFDGEQRTMSQMRRYLAASDRTVREKAWWAIRDEVAETSDALEELFEELFELRHQIAQNAGFDNYRDYVFEAKLRDYGPEECLALAELVELEVLPLLQEIAEDTSQKLGVESYRPWDSSADPGGGEPLQPFETVDELKDGVQRMMGRIDDDFAEYFAGIREYMDLESRPNKSQGGFMTWYAWEQRPFIFSNASGNHSDIITLVHEAGHAFHNLMSVQARPMSETQPPMEFNEVASMTQELLHYRTIDEFYDEADQHRAITEHLRRIPRLLASIAQGDSFQQWLYTHPEHTREERRQKWIELNGRFSSHTDWSGIDESTIADTYHPILHFFIVPFYFIEYGFAQLGALQVATAAEQDLESAMQRYKEALALGPTKRVHDLFAAAGAEFVPTREKLHDLMNWVRRGLGL
jgi:oligoendopeptidase F